MIKSVLLFISMSIAIIFLYDFLYKTRMYPSDVEFYGLQKEKVWGLLGEPSRAENEIKGGDAWGVCGLILCTYVQIFYDENGFAIDLKKVYRLKRVI